MLRRKLSWLTLALLGVVLSTSLERSQANESLEGLLQQSRQRYDRGELSQAKTLLQQVQQQAQGQGQELLAAVALSNLALIEADQGAWTAANQAIGDSLKILQTLSRSTAQSTVMAQTLNVKGRIQLDQGESQAAFQTWQQTATLYRQIGNTTGEIQSQLRQAQALQSLGLHDRAYEEFLEPMHKRLEQQPDSAVKVWGLRSVGEAIGVLKDTDKAQNILQTSLSIAESLKQPQEIAASRLALANLLYTRIREKRKAASLKSWERQQLEQDTNQAIRLYEQIAAAPSANQLRAELNHLALLLSLDNRTNEAAQLATRLEPKITRLPPDRTGIEARLNFANSLLRLQKAGQPGSSATELLTVAVDQAKSLNDSRLVGNALGNLGRAQEQNNQLTQAQTSTESALLAAKSANAREQIYRWAAQLGRLQEKAGNRQAAIASYTQAVNTLRVLRLDLLGINSESQLVDEEALEPVHRQLVGLLLPKDGSQPDSATLKRTRDIIESLQLEEINNYLRAACLQAQVEIDRIPVPQQTAIVYPMLLPDRIAIIVSATGQEPRLYTQKIPQEKVEAMVKDLQDGLRNRISLEYKKPSEQIYNWIIQPIEAELQKHKTETLVFVLDGALRSVPMAALSDGEQFLIEKYSIATTPGLKLTSPQPLQARTLSSVAFGLTKEKTVQLPNGRKQSFSELPFVAPELEDLQQEINPTTVKLNEAFTSKQFEEVLRTSQAPIVHLATHGQFSSNRDQTFLLASAGEGTQGEVISIDQLAEALGAGGGIRTTPIELLVLSACETATGDDRAPLGLAGIALKSGARSTVASLWKVNDNATSVLMRRFYKEIATRQVSKAGALQRAQREILDDPQFRRHPYFWAPFILVGNWL